MPAMPQGEIRNTARGYPAVSGRAYLSLRSGRIPMTKLRVATPAFARGHPVRLPARALMESIMNANIRKFFAEEDGVTALEYGLLAAVVAGALVVVAGPALRTFFTNLFAQLTAVVNAAFN